MVQRILMTILVLVIVVGGGYYAYQELMPPELDTGSEIVYATKEVTRGNISVGVEVTGRLDTSNSGALRVAGSYRSGGSFQAIIDEILVEEGDVVKQGQVVALLSSPDLLTKIEKAEEDLKTKRKQLSDMCRVPVEEVDELNPSRGITITAPIDGIVSDLDIEEGEELKRGTIARIVDNSRFKVEARLFEREVEKVKEEQTVVLTFPYFNGEYEATITKINQNRIPYIPEEAEEKFAKGFVHVVTIEADNMGLVQRDMEVRVGLRHENDKSIVQNFSNAAKVKGFIKEDKVINTVEEAVVTEVHVDDMAAVKKGDPIVTMSGEDTQKEIENKLEEIQELKTDIRELTAQLEKLEVKAPMDGIVARFYSDIGEEVGSGDWMGTVYTVKDMRLRTYVDDIDVLHVKQGAPVRVVVDALVDKSFEGTVEKVETTGEERNGISKFEAIIKVTGSSELRPGMQGKGFIDAGSAENVLLVVQEAIFEDDGKPMVEVLKDDGTTKIVPVKLGLMNDRVAEVESGLEEGDKVVTGSSADLLPSQSIKNEGGLLPDTPDGNGGGSDPQNGDKK